jgi:uncharacterized membrane protein
MNTTVFVELKFWLLIVFSLIIPLLIYAILLTKKSIKRSTVLIFGMVLIIIAGIDIYLLQNLMTLAKFTSSLVDDKVFASEISISLYMLPLLFGGVGVNLISHVLIHHLTEAEKRFEEKHGNG